MADDPRLKNKYYAWFLVKGCDETPDIITKQLGIEPTKTYVKGEYRTVGKKKPTKVINKENLWILDSDLPTDASLEKHIERLMKKIEPYKNNFSEIANRCLLELNFAIYYYEVNPGISLDKTILKEISSLGASLNFDIYCLN